MAESRSPLNRVMGAIAPRAAGAVDAVVGQLDVDQLIEHVDVDGLIQRVDIDALMQRVDSYGLLARIDMDALLARIDVDGLISRVDVEVLIGKLDMNALIGQLDLDQVLASVDVKALVAKAGIDDIVAEATTGMAARTIDMVRRQLVGLDIIALGGVDRLFRRPRPEIPAEGASATGRPAGPISRLAAFAVDAFFVTVMFSAMIALGSFLIELFTGQNVDPARGSGIGWTIAYFSWWGVYLWVSLEIAGRTIGKALFGLRVVALDGRPIGPGPALARTVVFPFSFILGLGFIPGVVRRDRRTLHDLVAGCQELVDWGDRSAEIPSALEHWLDRQRPQVEGTPDLIDATARVGAPGPAVATEVLVVVDEAAAAAADPVPDVNDPSPDASALSEVPDVTEPAET